MEQIIIKKNAISRDAKACPCCGFNTNLFDDNRKYSVNEHIYCNGCSDTANNKKVTKRDFYEFFFEHHKDKSHFDKQIKISALIGRKRLESTEIAHLCGGRYSEYVYVDMYRDPDDNSVYFRACCSNDKDDDEDDGFWGDSEQFEFLSAEELVGLLNKNNIHFFDGLTEENISSVLIFE